MKTLLLDPPSDTVGLEDAHLTCFGGGPQPNRVLVMVLNHRVFFANQTGPKYHWRTANGRSGLAERDDWAAFVEQMRTVGANNSGVLFLVFDSALHAARVAITKGWVL